MKQPQIRPFTPVFTNFFTRNSAYKIQWQGLATSLSVKSAAKKFTKSGGSDPTFCASIRPKGFVGSLPPDCAMRAQAFSSAALQDRGPQ